MADNKTNEYDSNPSGENPREKCGHHAPSDYPQPSDQPQGYWQTPSDYPQQQPTDYPPSEYPQPPTGGQPQGYPPPSSQPPAGYPTPPPGQPYLPQGYPPPLPTGYQPPPTQGSPPAGYPPPPTTYPIPPTQGYPAPPPTGEQPPTYPPPPTQGYPPPPQDYPTTPPSQGYPTPTTQPPIEGYPMPPSEGYPTPPGQGGYQTPPGQGGYQAPPGQGGYQTPPGQGGYQTPPGQGGYQYAQLPDPQARITELKKELARAKAEKDRYTELEQKLTEDVTASEQVGDELTQILTAYEQALPNLIKDYKDAQTYADTKMRMILCAVEKKKPEIDQKIAQYDQQIHQKAAAVEQLKAKKKAAEDLVKQAQEEKTKKDEQYKYWHDLQGENEKKLQEIKDLKKQIEQEDEASHAASMYFLALELQRVLQSIKIVNKQDLKYYLLTTLTERDKANQALRQRESELSQVTSTLNTEQSDLDQLKEKRRENILKIVATCDEPQEQQKKAQAAK